MGKILLTAMVILCLLCPCACAAYSQMTDYTAYFFEGDLYITNNFAELEIGEISVYHRNAVFNWDKPIGYIDSEGLTIEKGETKCVATLKTFKKMAGDHSSLKIRIEPKEEIKSNFPEFCNAPILFFNDISVQAKLWVALVTAGLIGRLIFLLKEKYRSKAQ